MTFHKKHVLASIAIDLSYFLQFYPKGKKFSSPKFGFSWILFRKIYILQGAAEGNGRPILRGNSLALRKVRP
ncbi:hypothetical protein, partial [Selenomonas sp.]|uniref:hypothetical protein n=1 Tax=Selenomonas sp. TaxID=2053611 RepID=UPI003FA20EDD